MAVDAASENQNSNIMSLSQPEPATPTASQPPAGFSSPNPPAAPAATNSNNRDDAISRPIPPDADAISIPSYSRWFSWDNIHQCELRFLPEFFDGRSTSKNPKVYKYYRNAIIQRFRDNPSRKITFTEIRKTIIGDVGSIRRVFDFLETWGLINYSPPPSSASSKPQLKWEDKDPNQSKSTPPPPSQADVPAVSATASDNTNTSQQPRKRFCNDCKCVCSVSCFTSDKRDLTLCGRCFVLRMGSNTSDFRRVEITEVVKNDWTEKDTLLLLEAVMYYRDDWKKVAARVTGKSDRDCVNHFIKLPFGDQFVGTPESPEMEHELGSKVPPFANKRMRLTPLADASNPIMAQAAFLSALVGVEVAEVAAHAAVTSSSDCNVTKNKEILKYVTNGSQNQDSNVVHNGDIANRMDGALAEAQLQLKKEEEDLERAITDIAAQTKELQDKIIRFEELDLQHERECQQMQQLKDLLFVDQLTLQMDKAATQKTDDSFVEIVKLE